ncbi:helix-turn-helix domain-containing protein [Streptomyces brevispora]|uniref:helix-turn-helix domain-containing protein n=1 Tax=Streptomyces brevispora TaxID=887462 RepID=UPI0037FFEE98
MSITPELNEEPQLPPPAERARLREAAGITQARLAAALKTTTQSVKNWENGRSEPKSPRLDAYQRLLDGWAAKYPTNGTLAVPAPVVAPQPEMPEALAGPAAAHVLQETVAPQAPTVQAAPERPAARPATARQIEALANPPISAGRCRRDAQPGR